MDKRTRKLMATFALLLGFSSVGSLDSRNYPPEAGQPPTTQEAPALAEAPTTPKEEAAPFGKKRMEKREIPSWERPAPSQEALSHYDRIFEHYPQYTSDGFDFPVGKPDGRGYYVARKFQEARHLGDDMNAVTGGDTDLGDPIYAIAHGFVTFSHDLEGGWGNTLRIVHRLPNGDYVESLYSHCNELFVEYGTFVNRGDEIGTIGTAHGMYPAHLHLELRTQVDMPLGRGYSSDPTGYTSPTRFIWKHRPNRY